MMGAACRRHGRWDLHLKWEACGIRGPLAGAALRRRPKRVALRLKPRRRCPPMPRRRQPLATSTQQQGPAPQPTPPHWNAELVSAPSGRRPRSAKVFPPGPWTKKEPFPANRLVSLVQASGRVVRLTSAHPIQLVRLPGGASGEVRVTCGSTRIHDDPGLR
jgi:hypothetical protein